MNFTEAHAFTRTFWQQPEYTPFPADVQDKLLDSRFCSFRHMGAMSVVYNGLLAQDIAYVDAAEEILQETDLEAGNTADAMSIVRDICYMGLFRAIIKPEEYGDNFSLDPVLALKSCLSYRKNNRDKDGFHAGEAVGAASEAFVLWLLSDAGFKVTPSFPWQDMPYGVDAEQPNPAFDIYVSTDGVSKHKLQIKSSLTRPPSYIDKVASESWDCFDEETKKAILASSYADDIAIIVLETDLRIPVGRQFTHFEAFLKQKAHSNVVDNWKLMAMNKATEVIW